MFWNVLPWCLLLRVVHSAKQSPHRSLVAAWCELHPGGVAYSRGEFFPCPKEDIECLSDFGSLKGVTLRVGMIEGCDFDYDCTLDVGKGIVKTKDSYGLYLLTILQEVLHFDIEFVSAPAWGHLDASNGTWTGLAALLALNRTDLVACHWTQTAVLGGIADYLLSTLETSEAFVYIPQNLPLTEDVFVEAFSHKLWIFFLLSIFLLIASFWFSTYAHSRVRPDHEPWHWDEVVLWAIAAISQQSYSRHPRGSSCRTMFLIGYLIGYLFYTGFAAGITSLLALQSQQDRLTFADVVALDLHLVLQPDEFYDDFLQIPGGRSGHPDVRRTEAKSLQQIFQEIRRPNVVGFGATVTFLHHLRKELDRGRYRDCWVVPVPRSDRQKAFLVRKSFPHRRLFDYWLLRLRESGLLEHGKQRYLQTEWAGHQAAIWFSAGLGNVVSALTFLSAGCLLSVLVLFWEILRDKRSKEEHEKGSLWGQMDDHPYVLHGQKIPLEIPSIGLGQFIFARLKTHNPYDVMMFEAETGRLITPVEFLSLSIRVAEGLREAGIRPGDVVCLVGKAKIDVYATATGILFQGATVCPLDHNHPPDILRDILKATAPKLVFCDAEIADGLGGLLSQLDIPGPAILYNEDPDSETSRTFERFIKAEADFRRFRPVQPEDPEESVAFLVCSSGTTGLPKPVMITDRNLMYQAVVWGLAASFNKVLTCPAITFSFFFWISGVLLYLSVVCINFEMTIVQKLEARHVLQVIDRQKPVWGMFSPALLKYLTWQPDFKNYNVSSLLMMITGGTSLQKTIADKVKELWSPYLSCRQSYGVTELSGSATTSSLGDDVLSVGRLLPGFHMKVISLVDGSVLGPGEEGELYFKSPSVMKGYMGNEKASREAVLDGWYKSGDLGHYTDKGLIYITGRVKDLINFKGTMISPQDIEEVILAIPGVIDAGVVGILADGGPQLPTALVVKAPGCGLTPEDVVQRANENLPENKRLQGGVFFVDFIPRTPSGKMKRADLLKKAETLV